MPPPPARWLRWPTGCPAGGDPGGDGVDVGLLDGRRLAAGSRRVRLVAGHARDVKNVPGRPKTDKADAVWLAKVAGRGRCRPWLVHPARSASCGT
jgi:hypothetical protein